HREQPLASVLERLAGTALGPLCARQRLALQGREPLPPSLPGRRRAGLAGRRRRLPALGGRRAIQRFLAAHLLPDADGSVDVAVGAGVGPERALALDPGDAVLAAQLLDGGLEAAGGLPARAALLRQHLAVVAEFAPVLELRPLVGLRTPSCGPVAEPAQ